MRHRRIYLLNITVLELIGMMNKLTPVEIAKAVRNAFNNSLISDSPAIIVGSNGPKVNATLVKMLYIMTGN